MAEMMIPEENAFLEIKIPGEELDLV